MKRLKLTLAALLALAIAGCHTYIPASQLGGSPVNSSETASVKVSFGGFKPKVTQSGFGIQALPVYAIAKATVEISGPGIAAVLTSADNAIVNGDGSYSFDRVPMGKNRIFTAIGLDANDQPVPGAVLRNVADITFGENVVDLAWPTTPTGDVFAYLLEKDLADSDGNPATNYASSVTRTAVQNFVTSMLTWPTFGGRHPSLVNGEAIGQAIINAAGALPGAPHMAYVRSRATVKLIVNGLEDGETFNAWIDDPASSYQAGLAPEVEHTFSDVIAGKKWKLHIVTNDFDPIEEEIDLTAVATLNIQLDFAGSAKGNIDYTVDDMAPQPDNIWGLPKSVSGTHYARTDY
jgi:hypothetical protein